MPCTCSRCRSRPPHPTCRLHCLLMRSDMTRIVIASGSALLISAALLAQSGAKPGDGDWPLYSRDLAGTKYSPLAQITADNVARLTEAWSVRLVPPAAGRRGGAAAAASEPPAAAAAAAGGAAAAPAQAPAGRGRGAAAAEGAANPAGNPEATPVVVNGVMYLPVGSTRVLALDAETGKELWRH